MPASLGVVLSPGFILRSLISLFVLSPPVLAQTGINDVHIMPRDAIVGMSTAKSGLQLLGGTYMHVIRRDVSLVLIPVSVTDPSQRLVVGLHPENFEVFEGKKPQEIKNFSMEDAPLSVGFIVDTSGSMADKMDRVREALHQFCEAANLQDEFFMVTFNDQPRLAVDFTNQPEEVEKELLFTQVKGRTSLLDAVHMGLQKMKEARYPKKALLVISDGGDNHSRHSERDIKSAVKESDVMLYAIGTFDRFVPTQEERLGPMLLSELSEPTGGRAFVIQDARQLPEVAHRVGVELRTQYVLGYRPQDAPHDGKWHKISVKLKLPQKLAFLRVHARTGYYAHQSREE